MTASHSRSGHSAQVASSYLNTREYEEPAMIKRFSPIADAIRSRSEEELGFDSSDVTSRSLSILTGNLRAFTETALGKNAHKSPKTPHVTKFPHRLFSDYQPDGALFVMLCACLNFKCLHGLRRLEFQNPDKASLLFDLIIRVEKELEKAGMLPSVNVFLSRSIPTNSLPALRSIIEKRGSIVSSASAATHVIYDDPPGTSASETAGTDYCRPLRVSDTHALVHWWYYPDSYDSWIPRNEVDGVVEPPEDHRNPWHVQMRWLYDTDLFNEWMNEGDYEMPNEMRMKMSSSSRDTARVTPRIETSRNHSSSVRSETERLSKKRRRYSQRESDRHTERLVEKEDEMDLGDSPVESDEVTIKPARSRRGSADSTTREKKNRDSRRDSAGEPNPRKKARVSDDRKKSLHSKGEQTGIKLRLQLKPISGVSKERNREREKKKESKSKDASRDGKYREKTKGDIRLKEPKGEGRSKETKLREGVKVIIKGRDDSKPNNFSNHAEGLKPEPCDEASVNDIGGDSASGAFEAPKDEESCRNLSRPDFHRKDTPKLVIKLNDDSKESAPKTKEISSLDRKIKDQSLIGKGNLLESKVISSGPKVRIKLGGIVTDAHPPMQSIEIKSQAVNQRGQKLPSPQKPTRELSSSPHVSVEKETDGASKPSSLLPLAGLSSEGNQKTVEVGSSSVKAGGKLEDHLASTEYGEGTDRKIASELEKSQDGLGELGQDQKRPFSRRKRSRKERNQQNRASGLNVVEDAIPIPEGDVPRIRNISQNGIGPNGPLTMATPMDIDNKRSVGQPQSAQTIQVTGIDATSGKQHVSPTHYNGVVDNANSMMDVDNLENVGRPTAVPERSISGVTAAAPASGADAIGVLPPKMIRMPAQSRWFRMDAIHDIEKRALPEFFDRRSQSKTPAVYKKYRDFIIHVWRQAPEKYLTATTARRHLAGDVCAILRVYTFLERWGLINYGVEPESKAFLNSSLRTRGVRPKPILLDEQASNYASGVPRLFFFDEPKPPKRNSGPMSLQKAVTSAKEKSVQEKRSLLSTRELYAIAAATKYECDGCGKDCSRMRYHCIASADLELCPDCFANGRYPQILSARDFEQLTTLLDSEAYDKSVWSEEEVLLLLEGLEKYGDDWTQVAEHVGSKSDDQCVLQFLRMPIEDSFLGDQFGRWGVDHNNISDQDVIQEGDVGSSIKFAGPELPFADASNPVMAQVAFLASCVSPEVAAAAAQAALAELLKETGENMQGESRSAQAKALLSASDGDKSSLIANANGSGDTVDRKSKLATLSSRELDAVAVEAAASVGLAAAVVRARQLADAETREIERNFSVVVETKMKMVDLKLQEFDSFEQHLRRERDRLEKQRMGLYAARLGAAVSKSLPAQYIATGQPLSALGQQISRQVHHSLNTGSRMSIANRPLGGMSSTIPSNGFQDGNCLGSQPGDVTAQFAPNLTVSGSIIRTGVPPPTGTPGGVQHVVEVKGQTCLPTQSPGSQGMGLSSQNRITTVLQHNVESPPQGLNQTSGREGQFGNQATTNDAQQ